MISRRALAAGIPAALSLPGLARAADLLPPIGDIVPPPGVPDTDLRTGRDILRRLTIEVMIGQAGPYRFVVDTGADRSVVADDVAAGLRLEPGPAILVHGIAGAEMTPTLRAPPLKVGNLTLASGHLPVLPRSRLGADGMLGVDVLQGRRLIMDIKNRALRIRRSEPYEGVPVGGDTMVVRAMKRFGRLAVVDAVAESVGVTTFIDSGAELSVGNGALAERLGARKEGDTPTSLFGVTERPAYGFVRPVRMLKMGGVEFSDISLVFADLHLFDIWGLKEKPAVLLGMDILEMFSRVELDYGQRQMLFRLGLAKQLPAVQLAQG